MFPPKPKKIIYLNEPNAMKRVYKLGVLCVYSTTDNY